MTLNRYTLAFQGDDAPLEPEFLRDFRSGSLRHVRLAIIIGAILIGSFGFLYAYLLPEQKYFAWFIRFGILTPGALLLALTTFHKRLVRLLPILLPVMLVVSAGGFNLMTVRIDAPANYLYYTGIILVLFYGYTLLRQRFIWSSLAGLLITIIYEVTAVGMANIPPLIFLNNTFFLVTSNLIGMMAAYAFEYYARKAFYLTHRLEIERQNVSAANVELESRVLERTRELKERNDELRREISDRQRLEEERLSLDRRLHQARSMESLGVLAGGIAHDFNNILTGLLGNAELAKNRVPEGNPLHRYLDRILAGTERARVLVQQILTFSRRQRSERRPITLGSAIDDAVRSLRSNLPPGVTLQVEHGETPAVIHADPGQIQEVVTNLCTNAIHAVETNGGTVTVAERIVTTETSLLPDANELAPGTYALLSVHDDGPGIPAELLPKLFEPFFTTREQGKGTGLGLAVVHGIVHSHKGTVLVQTQEGAGATFNVYIPLHPGTVPMAPDAPPVPQPHRRTGHVLVVDDQSDALDVAREMLTDLGFRVTCYNDPVVAASAITAAPHAFDALVTDLSMPGMSGTALAAISSKLRPDAPVLLVTGYQRPDAMRDLQQTGVRAVLSKPYRKDELAALLAQILPHSSA